MNFWEGQILGKINYFIHDQNLYIFQKKPTKKLSFQQLQLIRRDPTIMDGGSIPY